MAKSGHDSRDTAGARSADISGATTTTTATGSLTPSTPRGENTKRRILDAAEEVFGALGYYEASVSEITRRAGVAQGTFYIYFHSKREIFEELIADLGDRVRGAMREATVGVANRLEAERRGFAAFFAFVQNHRLIYQIVQEAERVAPEAAMNYYRRISAGYVRGLSAAMESGSVRQLDPEAVAYALMGVGHFLALRWIIWSVEEREAADPGIPGAVFESALQFIEHGLAPMSGRDSAPSDTTN